jgi:hypothetical protein
MSDKKNIDRLFQEQFKDFEATPEKHVWSNINAALNNQEKKKRRIIPLWLRLAGTAALLALLFSVGYAIFKTDDKVIPTQIITDTQPEELPETNKTIDKAIPVETTEDNAVSSSTKQQEQEVARTASEKQQNVTSTSSHHTNKKTVTDKIPKNDAIALQEKGIVIKQKNNSINKEAISNILENTKEKGLATAKNTTEETNETNKMSIVDAAKEQANLMEEEEEETANSKRWGISPNVAPVYFNSLSGGSSLDAAFADNAKSGEVNMSYGINVTYEVNKRLSIRSGVSKVNYGYTTNGITFSPSLQANRFQNIEPREGTLNIEVNDTGTKSLNNIGDVIETSARTAQFNGDMTQQLGYIEVPFEAKYKLIDKKIGVNVIGGFSSLFLTDNTVLLESRGLKTELGKATNVNDVNFSTNFGLGIDYKLTPSLQLNLEPMIKYQLNTFSNSVGNFRPYSLGVYTGFSFRF